MNSEKKSTVPSQSILVVDDEPQACEIISDALSSQGHIVESAGDGMEAIEKIKRSVFSIIVTDMDMPQMDGMQLIEYIARNNIDIDIIAITGHIMKYTYTEVVEAGAADFITKPFSLNELEAKLNRLIRERILRKQLAKLAVRDPLTSLPNRRSFEENARKEAIRTIRYQHTLYLFFMDVDNFKKYNDLYGHQAGDALLIEMANILENSIRENIDSVYRYGGDEFVMLVPHLPAAQALSVAERICGKFDSLKLEPTSISIGIAKFIEKSGSIDQDIQDMIQRADSALYAAKKSPGKNGILVDEGSL
ncbi:Response regulator receiver modulated diguanylate cyclase [Syntrophobacter sp. SbD1]|nr:Response regulator receiver modulated diguanylate cyclase [Syntrophobacter sp. SbD1]